ncbi:HEAT repeat domain-containing protein [Lysinibacillus sp. LZ02]|uniref:HEAT repeat domain-containing protein n=1 Tax=Lysinibacillus sp. LZ02 TaxID=3420668 RepID=UPI003D35DEFC
MITNSTLLYALVIISILLLLISCMFLYLVVMRMRQTYREKMINAYIKEHKDNWYRYLVLGQDIELFSKSHAIDSYTKEAIDRIFINYVTTINNEDIIERISYFSYLNFQKYYRNMLQHRNWGVRMNGLYRTLDFRLTFLVPDVEHLLKNKKYSTEEEYLLMLRIVAIYNKNLFLAHFYKPAYPFKEFEYKTILSHLDDHYIETFIASFDTLSPYLQLSLLDYLSFDSKMDISYLAFYEKLLSHYENEIRIRALKAISHFGMISSIHLYKPFIHSPYWEERLMLAKLLVHAEEKDAKLIFEKLLQDESWWVRKQAAVSLNNLRYGVDILQKIAEQQEDRYAADMAKEILQVG